MNLGSFHYSEEMLTECLSRKGRTWRTRYGAALFCPLLVLFVGCNLLPVSGVDSPEAAQSPPIEKVLDYLSNGKTWIWSERENPDASSKTLTTWLGSWCGDEWRRAMEEAAEITKKFDNLKQARDDQYEDLKHCQFEKAAEEEKLRRNCVKQQKVSSASYAKERAMLQAEYDRERTEMMADLESCRLKARGRVEAACERDAAIAEATAVSEVDQLKAALEACEQQRKSCEVEPLSKTETEIAKMAEEREEWVQEQAGLTTEMAECRPAKARAEAELSAFNLDVNQKSLQETVRWLGATVVLMLLLLAASFGGAAYLMFFQDKNGGVVGAMSRVSPPLARVQFRTAELAVAELQEFYERGSASSEPIILTASSEGEGGPSLVFLLLPLHLTIPHRVSLFGEGGDYTSHLERAQEFVSKTAPKARLVVVLYEASGCVVTDETLKNLRLTADKIADEAVPRDAEFPRHHDVIMLWSNPTEGLRVANNEGVSDLESTVKEQLWAEYLLSRSVRNSEMDQSSAS